MSVKPGVPDDFLSHSTQFVCEHSRRTFVGSKKLMSPTVYVLIEVMSTLSQASEVAFPKLVIERTWCLRLERLLYKHARRMTKGRSQNAYEYLA